VYKILITRLLLATVIVFAFYSCKKEEQDPVLIFLDPPEVFVSAMANDIMGFGITCSAETSLSHFSIDYKESQSFTQKILDSALSVKNFKMTYEYPVPEFTNYKTEITLTFTATDNEGNQAQALKVITVRTPDQLLEEKSGNVMYSRASENHDSYDILQGIPLHSELTDSTGIHIMDNSVDSVNGHTLSRKWVSPAGWKFVRSASFDYANATRASLIDAYESSIEDDFVSNLQESDKLLMNKGNTYVAIMVTNIYDNDSTDNDRYVFTIKK
jgi:hypothetical protein